MSKLPDERTLAMARLLNIPYSPHQPYLKQARFLLDFSRDALYGGAAGGGKSDALLMAALQFIDVPGYSAILFRRSFADLSQEGALMSRAQEWFTPHKSEGVRWNEIEHKWRFPSGASITFAYIDRQTDHLKYQGAEFQFIGFDELTQFKEKQYRYMFSRLRKVDDPNSPLARVPLRMRAATNPGGPGHHWVYLRYVKPWEEYMKRKAEWARLTPEVRASGMYPEPGEYPPKKLGEDGNPKVDNLGNVIRAGRFYPATIEDNPFLNTGDYEESLDNLDHVTKLQLRKGDWQIKPDGRMFKRTWFKIIPEAPSDCIWVRWWDLAATDEDPDKDPDYTAGALLGRTPSGMLILKHMVHIRVNDFEVEQAVKQTAALDGVSVPIGMEQEPGSSGKTVIGHYRRVVLPGYDFRGVPASGSKIDRARPFAARAAAGDIAIVAGAWVPDFLDEAEVFPDGEHDDQIDAVSAAYLFLSGKMDAAGGGGFAPVSLEQDSYWKGEGLRSDWAA